MGSKVKINKRPSLRALFSRAWQSLVVMISILTASPFAFANGIDFSDSQGYFGIPHDNVGIGSSAPGQKLDVQGTVRATGFIAGAGGITLGGVNNTSWPSSGSNYWLNTAAAGNVGISTTNSVGIGTTSGVGAGLVVMNGNVGIGTWVPAGQLDVEGTLSKTIFGGNVGIGTTNPSYNLEVDGSGNPVLSHFYANNPTSYADVLIENTATGSNSFNQSGIRLTVNGDSLGGVKFGKTTFAGPYGGEAYFWNFENSPLVFATDNAARMGISASGQLYTIGGALAGVNDAVSLQSASSSDGAVNDIQWYQTGGSLNLGRFGVAWNNTTSQMNFVWRDLYNGGVGSTELMRLTGSGNLGIGSQWPGQRLDIQGTARMTGFNLSTSPTNGYVLTSDANGNGTWAAAGGGGGWSTGTGTVYTTTASNNVGIGTNIPAGFVTVEEGTYTSNELLLNNGVTGSPDVYPVDGGGHNYTPTLSVSDAEVNGSRPLWFGYKNGSNWDSFLTAGACGAFGQMCLDMGDGTSVYTALASNGSNLAIGGNTNASPFVATDGQFTNVYFGNTGNTLIPNGNTGIGLTGPVNKLDVNGSMAIGSYAGTNTATSNGLIVSGNVGIGSIAPGQALDVQGTIRMTGFNIASGAGANKVLTSDANGNGTWAAASVGSNYWLNTAAAGNVGISTINTVGIGTTSGVGAGLVVMNGNVGIGTWAPAGSLIVKGGNVGIGTNIPNAALAFSPGTTAAGGINFGDSTADLYRSAAGAIQTDGGFTASARILSGGSFPGFQSAFDSNSGYLFSDTSSATSLDLYTSGASRIHVANGGNVGIGSINPGQVLDVNGTVRATGFIAGTGGITLGGVNNTAWPANYWLNTAAAGNVGISTTNTVGIGTTSGVGAGLVVMNGNVGIGTWNPSAEFQVNNLTSSPFVITSAGNVGIGTTTPQGGLVVTSGNVGIGTWTAAGGSLIVATGNVGIGTAFPGFPLDVDANARITGTGNYLTGRWKARVATVTQQAAISLNADNMDVAQITGLAQAITSVTITGTPNDGDVIEIQITDNGTARAITWSGTTTINSTSVTLPTTTVISTELRVFLQWQASASAWECIGVA